MIGPYLWFLPPAFFSQAGHGCDRHPAFPAPSSSRGRWDEQHSDADAGARMRCRADKFRCRPGQAATTRQRRRSADPGPIIRGGRVRHGGAASFGANSLRWLWIPAFAGMTPNVRMRRWPSKAPRKGQLWTFPSAVGTHPSALLPAQSRKKPTEPLPPFRYTARV